MHCLVLGRLFLEKRLVDVGDHTAAGNGSLDECVKLLITTDGQLQVTGSDTLHAQIFRRVASELEHLGSQVLQNGSRVDGGGSTNTALICDTLLQVAVNTADREL